MQSMEKEQAGNTNETQRQRKGRHARAHTHIYTNTVVVVVAGSKQAPFANKTPNTNRLGTQKERRLTRSVAPNKPPLQQQPPTYPQILFSHN
jgi:hypothetical protein